MVTKSKSKGGLGVINLRLQNDVLLLKKISINFTTEDLPWVKLIWTNYYCDGKFPS
jgi:hypothetical protein